MSDRLPAGPYRRVPFGDGTMFPYYVIPFDKQGHCEGPETQRYLLENDRFSFVILGDPTVSLSPWTKVG